LLELFGSCRPSERAHAGVLLTRIGGGAFDNDGAWIDAAIKRALEKMTAFALDVRVVSYGPPPAAILRMVESFA
jgi:hypothetical protein